MVHIKNQKHCNKWKAKETHKGRYIKHVFEGQKVLKFYSKDKKQFGF